MEIFIYNPSHRPEELREFNDRLGEFCRDNPVVEISADLFGSALVIQCKVLDDVPESIPVAGAPLLTATVRNHKDSDPNLEEAMTAVRDKIEDSEDDGLSLHRVLLVSRSDKPGVGYGVYVCMDGVVEDDEEQPVIGPDDPCPCGSGHKAKDCDCQDDEEEGDEDDEDDGTTPVTPERI